MTTKSATIRERTVTARVTSRLKHRGDVTLAEGDVYPVYRISSVCGIPAVWLDLGDETYAVVQPFGVTIES